MKNPKSHLSRLSTATEPPKSQNEIRKGVIYYDGLCKACSLEINHYRKQKGAEFFNFVNITTSDFEPQNHGLDPFKVHKVMHVRDRNGNLKEGVDAFRAIWNELPRYRFLVRLSDYRAVRAILELGYRGFIQIRPYLPRRKAEDCSASPYCDLPKSN